MAGVLLLLPSACTFMRSAPNSEDLGVAFTEVVRIRLNSLRADAPIRFVFTVPNSEQWTRLRRAWGDHGYIVYAMRKESATPWIIPFSTLQANMTVTRSGVSLPIERPTGCPYLISSNAGADCAVAFKPNPGDELEITLSPGSDESLPQGDFVIEPYWGGYEKDRIVTAGLDSSVRPYLLGGGMLGVALLIASAVMSLRSARRTLES